MSVGWAKSAELTIRRAWEEGPGYRQQLGALAPGRQVCLLTWEVGHMPQIASLDEAALPQHGTVFHLLLGPGSQILHVLRARVRRAAALVCVGGGPR